MMGKRNKKIFALSFAIGIMLVTLSPVAHCINIINEVNGFPLGWTNDTRLTNSISPDTNPSIVAFQDNVHIIWKDIWLGDGRVFYSNSTDGGQFWSNHRQLNIGGDGDYPDIAINTTNLHVVYDDNIGVSNTEISYCNSTDGGISWSSPKYMSVDDGFGSRSPRIAINNSNIHLVWTDSRLAQTEVYYKRSIDGGITWSDALGGNTDRRITHDLSGAGPVGIEVNNSNIHVLFMDDRDGSADVYYIRSTDNGVTWDDGLGVVDNERKLTSNTTDRIGASIAINGSTIHVAWVDMDWPGPIFSIYYQNSTDNGATWGTIQQLVSPLPGTAYAPNLAVQNDIVHMTWHDMRDGGQPEIYYKNSTNSGATWSSDLRLTELDGFSSGGPKIALSGSQRHIIWEDQRDGNKEVYYKRFPEVLPDTELPEISPAPVVSANINQSINITANITDNVGVNQVYLNYTGVNGTNYNESMTQWNGNWSYDIPGQENIGIVEYFIWANDTSGNVNMTSVNSIQINDLTKPEINHLPIVSANVFDMINVTANITDDVVVNKVFLDYTGVNGTNYNVSMNKWSGNYSYDIPGQDNIGTVEYFIWANDTSDNDNQTITYQIQIFDVTDPEINHVPITSANISETINITANVTDDVSVNSVYLNYTGVNGTTYNVSMVKWNENYSYEIPAQNTIGTINYFIWANDSDGNDNRTIEYSIQINELPIPPDTNPPEIEHTPVTSVNVSEMINITAVISDDVEVDKAYLNYTGIDGVNHNVSMTKWGSNWSFVISGQSDVGNVSYFIWCNDTSGNENRTIEYTIQINEIMIPDTTPPTVYSRTPTGNDVSVSTDITITFSEPMNRTSVENAMSMSPTFEILVSAWLNNTYTVRVIPYGNLSFGSTYNITIGTGAKDLAGNNLKNPYSWEFTTVEDPGIIEPPATQNNWWIGIIILLITIIMLALFSLVYKEK